MDIDMDVSTAPELSVSTRVFVIEHFSVQYANGNNCRSYAKTKAGVVWYSKLLYENDQKYLVLLFNLLKTSSRCRFSLLSAKDEKYTFNNFDLNIMKYINWVKIPIEAIFANPDYWLLDDKLRLSCEISVHDISNQRAVGDVKVPCCELLDDFKLLLDNEKLSDVILSAKGKEFKAHKVILAARSSVFQAMFEHQMKESKHNRVDIIDINPEVLLELLRFIYTGEVMNLDKIASDLLYAADKYALKRLKAMCEKELCSKLAIENVVKLLILADKHSADQLKSRAMNFVTIHGSRIMATPEWKDITQYPHLMNEIICAYASSKEESPVSSPEKTLPRKKKRTT